jgi:AcrR family transcriptional regulator
MDAVLDAATDLLAEQWPKAPTVRDIAARAGVNHALVHRYFGTKGELLKAVLDRHSARFAELAAGASDTRTAVSLLFREVTRRSAYVHVLARAAMDGMHPEQIVAGFPVMRGLLARLSEAPGRAEGAVDARVAIIGLAALALGWHIFDDYLVEAVGIGELPRDEVNARIEGLLQQLLVAIYPGVLDEPGVSQPLSSSPSQAS